MAHEQMHYELVVLSDKPNEHRSQNDFSDQELQI